MENSAVCGVILCTCFISALVFCKIVFACLCSDKFSGMTLLKRPESKTISALSDDEPLYDCVASDEDYSSIDSQSIRSMHAEMKGDITAEVGVSSLIICPVFRFPPPPPLNHYFLWKEDAFLNTCIHTVEYIVECKAIITMTDHS